MLPSLQHVHDANELIPSSLPPGLVAVFSGATSGIGAATLKAFVKQARQPRAYLIGRSEERARAMVEECKAINPDAEVEFFTADLSLMRNVDAVCAKIQAKESRINILMMTVGDPDFDKRRSDEGIHLFMASPAYGRTLMAYNLLPQLRNAASAKTLSRVITMATGATEGAIHLDDMQAINLSMSVVRGHLATFVTFALEAMAARAPGVSFIHTNPGWVRTPYQDRMTGVFGVLARIFMFVSTPKQIALDESAARHLYTATSGRYGLYGIQGSKDDVWPTGSSVVTGTDGTRGSFVFSLKSDLTAADGQPLQVMKEYRSEGLVEQAWSLIEEEYKRIGVGPTKFAA